MFRTRLTHSLEVAQLARSMARTLRLNEDLVEAIALAHDLGHTPFGHAGQDALNASLKASFDQHPQRGGQGGFEHNLQSLRVVDRLERRYAAFDGLNLCFETREGILKHCSRSHAQALSQRDSSGVADRFLNGGSPSLEAQLCNLADEIAYNAHDIDDGVRSGLLQLEQLNEVPLFAQYVREVERAFPVLDERRLLYESIRRMLSAQVYDVLDHTQSLLRDAGIRSLEEVRQQPPLVRFSDAMRTASSDLKRFLFQRLYRHPQVAATSERARRVVRDLFDHHMSADSDQMDDGAERRSKARQVADYIAGMTDRFAIRAHQQLTGEVLFP